MALFEIEDGRYFARVFYVGSPRAGLDVLGAIWRDRPGADWQFAYRFRYYSEESKSPHDDRDRKSAWRATVPASMPEAEVCAKVRKVFGQLAAVADLGEVDEVVLESDRAEVCLGKLLERPWNHVRPDGLGGEVGES